MIEDSVLLTIPGAQELVERFGRWPSFHDAEVISLELNRAGTSKIKIHVFEMTKRIDSRGFYVLDKHTIVNFRLEDVVDVELTEFSCQNVISGLEIERVEEGYRLILGPCYGIHGSVVTTQLSVGMEPFVLPQGVVDERAEVKL